jgi:hypothetical protein
MGRFHQPLRKTGKAIDMTTTTGRTANEPRRESLLTDFTLTPVPEQDRRRAALAICDRASSVEEARELLAALGLLDDKAVRRAA